MVHFSYKLLAAASLLAALATLEFATATAAESRIEITPLLGYRDGGQFKDGASGTTADLNGNGSVALAVNWRTADPDAQYELFYSRQSTDTDTAPSIDMKTEYLHIGGTTLLAESEGRMVPFAVGGIGAARFTPGLAGFSDETRWSLSLGGGVRLPLTKHIRLRFEARGYLTWLGGDASLFCSGGCVITAKSKTFFQYEALGGVSVSF
jgi:Outer membrane protein beta-barrel domain